MKKIKSSVLLGLPQLMKDLRRHYIPYIDDLCLLRGKTRLRPMVGRDTFHVLTGIDKSSSLSVETRVSGGENREPTSPLRYIFYSVLKEFLLFSPLNSFSLCRGSVSIDESD